MLVGNSHTKSDILHEGSPSFSCFTGASLLHLCGPGLRRSRRPLGGNLGARK